MAFWKTKKASNSDLEMIELIADIKSSFRFENLSEDHSGNGRTKRWTYIHNKVRFKFIDENESYTIYIDSDDLYLNLISTKLLKEMSDFFTEMEKNSKLQKNSKAFGKLLTSRLDAKKYNL